MFLDVITWFDHRIELSFETKDTFVDWYLSIQTTFHQEYNRMNEFYVFSYFLNK
jgi:hypothetical protein